MVTASMLSRHAIHAVIAVGAALAVPGGAALARDLPASPVAHAARTPVAVAAASPQCRHASDRGDGPRQERAILCLINAERARAGLTRLKRSRSLASAAEGHARNMVRRNFFNHYSPDGSTPGERAERAGYEPAMLAENIAFGTGSWGTPAGAVAQWLDSPPHRRAMLAPGARDIGVGAADGSPLPDVSGGTTVAAEFGRR